MGRVKKRSETWNATTNQWDFPQTPATLQISLWPGGAPTNAPGTVQWAGGPIDWGHPDIKNLGYYYATFGPISIECYNGSSGAGTNKRTSYVYNSAVGTNNTVIDGDKPTVLASFMGSGLDMNAGAGSNNDGNSPVAQIPGGSNVGPGQNPGGAASVIGAAGPTGTGTAQDCSATTFSQNCGAIGNKSEGVRRGALSLGASLMAVVAAVAGSFWL